MKATVDSLGRVVVPEPLRDALGLVPASTVDVSRYGAGLQLVPAGRTAVIEEEEEGRLVATGTTVVDDDVVLGLLDAGRR